MFKLTSDQKQEVLREFEKRIEHCENKTMIELYNLCKKDEAEEDLWYCLKMFFAMYGNK